MRNEFLLLPFHRLFTIFFKYFTIYLLCVRNELRLVIPIFRKPSSGNSPMVFQQHYRVKRKFIGFKCKYHLFNFHSMNCLIHSRACKLSEIIKIYTFLKKIISLKSTTNLRHLLPLIMKIAVNSPQLHFPFTITCP